MRLHVVLMMICCALIPSLAYAEVDQSVRIVVPQPDVTVHDNNGDLAVTVEISPPLDVEAGNRLALLLDEKVVASGTSRHFVLKGIDPGSHTLRVQVNAADGTVIATSPQVTFHMWHASRLFRDRHELK